MHYKASQYEHSACNGLGTVGGVCPGVLLPCHVSRRPWDGAAERLFDCIVPPLPGFGWNPAVVQVLASTLDRALA